jgi:hypothetical protein
MACGDREHTSVLSGIDSAPGYPSNSHTARPAASMDMQTKARFYKQSVQVHAVRHERVPRRWAHTAHR